jgi:hypothetical protein
MTRTMRSPPAMACRPAGTPPWLGGWMHSALESGERVAGEINDYPPGVNHTS